MLMKPLGAAALGLVLSAASVLADLPVLHVAALKSGTVNWELSTIAANGFDRENGFVLEVQDMAGNSASQVAFQAGEADAIVSDWLWVARQRASGDDFVFIPYSKAVGGLMVPGDSPAQTLADLKGGKIGVAGGPLDKSWLILRAFAQKQYGMDLQGETEQIFGAPPLIFQTAVSGDLDGAINFWHFMAKMGADGMRTLVTVADASEALGLDPDTPLLGYVIRGEMLRDQPELATGLARASQEAKELLATSDAAWDALRPQMHAANDAEFEALKAGFRAGIPVSAPVDVAAADRMLRLMAELGGPELVGEMDALPDGVFVQPGS